MKYLIVVIVVNIVLSAASQNTVPNKQKALSILQKASNTLKGLTRFSYDLKRELNYASEDYHNISEWSCYLNFDPNNNPVGFKYQITDTNSNNFFNGTEKFELKKSTKTIQINNNPQKNDFSQLSYLYNSIITLRNILPALIKEKNAIETATDTIINNHSYELVTINIGKRRIQNLGEGFDVMQTKSNFIYKITFDKISSLPVEVLQKNDLNEDFIKTNFTNFNPFPIQPAEKTWYYTTYLNEYTQTNQKVTAQLIELGSIAPDWTLPLYNKSENISLSKLRGNLILLDFWFKNCGPCIETVPHLNAINNKFKNREFEILAINTWDSKKDIDRFCIIHGVTYNVLMNGKELAENYGVNQFPTVIIIDKVGKVLYSGGFDQSKIEKLIEKAL